MVAYYRYGNRNSYVYYVYTAVEGAVPYLGKGAAFIERYVRKPRTSLEGIILYNGDRNGNIYIDDVHATVEGFFAYYRYRYGDSYTYYVTATVESAGTDARYGFAFIFGRQNHLGRHIVNVFCRDLVGIGIFKVGILEIPVRLRGVIVGIFRPAARANSVYVVMPERGNGFGKQYLITFRADLPF